jgi:hypothetical protein
VEASCLNQSTCNVPASNSVFGDPCVGTYKNLAVTYTCGDSSPPSSSGTEPWAKCLRQYAAGATQPDAEGVVRDQFGRNIDSRGLVLVDWEGPMGNPETTIQIAAPKEMKLPVKMFASVPGAPLIYLDAWSAIHDEEGSRTTKAIEFFNETDASTFRIGVNPDRDFDSETYALHLQFTSWDGTSKTVDVPIHVCDQDRDRLSEVKFARKYLDVYGDSWLAGGGEPWDYNEDGVHDGVQSKKLIDQITDDIEYYLAPWDVDPVPVGAANSHVIWDDRTVLPARQQNTEPFDQFYLFVSLGESATGLPGFTRHTRNGVPTDLANCGVVLIDRQLPPEWVATNHVDGWHFHDGASKDWWRSSKWLEGPSPTGDCPDGQSQCSYYASSFYSIMKHELLHTLAYEGGWPRWKHFEEVGCIDDEAVMAYTGHCTPVYGVHAWDEKLHLRAYNNGIELIDKFEMLVLQAVGWKLRETTPFVDLAVAHADWPQGTVGLAYEATLPVRGGVPAYRFVVAGGGLPPGLTLDGFTGKLSGIPTSAGRYRFDVEVTDSGLGQRVVIPVDVVVN